MKRKRRGVPAARQDAKGKALPIQHCPVCGERLDAATDTELKRAAHPRPGDLTLCIRCGEIYEFQRDMRIKAVTLDTLVNLSPAEHDTLEKAQALIRKLK